MPDGDSVKLDKFSGLRNTVSPERFGPTELARARDIDLDDAGQAHRRRGYQVARVGSYHSAHTTARGGVTFVVENGVFCQLHADFTTRPLQAGIAADPLCYVEVGPTLYVASRINSFQVDTGTGRTRAWGLVQDPNNRPGLRPGAADFWYSPVVNPLSDLPPQKGRLLGAPLPCSAMAYFNGRIFMAVGSTLWATELYLYDYVDRTRGFRQFEDEITAVAAVEDGLFIGTRSALYYLTGRFGEDERRVTKLDAGILPGSAQRVPSDLIAPENRARLDVPNVRSKAVVMMSTEGLVVCSNSGQVVNLTSAQFQFPRARSAASLYRQQDGMHTVLQSLNHGGTPATETARMGDYMDARIVRAYDRTDLDAATRATYREEAARRAPAFDVATQVRAALQKPFAIVDDATGEVLAVTGDGIEGLDGAGGSLGDTLLQSPDGSYIGNA